MANTPGDAASSVPVSGTSSRVLKVPLWAWPAVVTVGVALVGQWNPVGAAALIAVALGSASAVVMRAAWAGKPLGLAAAVGVATAVVLLMVLVWQRDLVQALAADAPHGATAGVAADLVPGADLSGYDLVGRDLRGIDLRGANLAGSDLAGADLSRANLSGAILRGANLENACLRRVVITGAVLAGANLVGADAGGAEGRPDAAGGVDWPPTPSDRVSCRG